MTLRSFLIRNRLQRKYKGRSADAAYQLRNNYGRGHKDATRDVKINRGKGFIPITGSYTITLATCTGTDTSSLSQPVREEGNNNPDKDDVNGMRNSVLHTRFKPSMLHETRDTSSFSKYHI